MFTHGSVYSHQPRSRIITSGMSLGMSLGWAVASCSLAWLALSLGCSGNDTANNATDKPRFEVADDDDTNPATAQSADQDSAEQEPAEVSQVPSPQLPAAPSDLAPETSSQPPSDPSAVLQEYETAGGKVEELLALISSVDARRPVGNTQQEQQADLVQSQQTIIEAADQVLASQEASSDQKYQAVQYKISALSTLSQFEVEGSRQQLLAFCEKLLQNEEPRMQEIARIVLLNEAYYAYRESGQDDTTKLLAQFKKTLAESEASESVFTSTRMLANELDRSGMSEAAQQAYAAIADKFAEHENPAIRNAVAGLRMQAKMGEVGFNDKILAVYQQQPDSVEPFMQAMQKLVEESKPSQPLVQVSTKASEIMEQTGHYEEALQAIQWAEQALAKVDDPKVKAEAAEEIASAKKRLGLIGKPLPLEGAVALDGQPFDWKTYRGNYVLVDFWASWCRPCIAEFPEMKKMYAAYQDQGFEIVGINLDDRAADAKSFLDENQLPWQTVVSGNPDQMGFRNPVAQYAAVEGIPFIVLVDPEGNVTELHVRGHKLGEMLREIYGPVKGNQAPDNDSLRAAPAQPASPNDGAAHRPRQRTAGQAFVSLLDDDAEQAEVEPTRTNEAVEKISTERAKVERKEDRKFGEIRGLDIDESINPYAPGPDLSKLELAQLLLEMRDKPQSIQRRPGFAEAVLMACDRLIELTQGEGRFYEIAVLEKLATLHNQASFGDQEADAKLEAFVDKLNGAKREKIAAEVAFLQIERRLIEVAESEETQVDDLLTELKAFYAEQELEEKHLRMASNTVKAINKIEDDETREKYFQEFGKLFATSDNKELSKYGKRIGKSEVAESDLVGKPLELEGITAAGIPLDWKSYRGQPVIVDFWATWCGPCRREMPKLQKLFTEQNPDGLEVIGISLDQDQEALATYLQENSIVWQTLVGEEAQELATQYGVRGIPTMMLVDAEGNVAAVAHNLAALLPKLKELQANAQQ